jgi:hypothetical protein
MAEGDQRSEQEKARAFHLKRWLPTLGGCRAVGAIGSCRLKRSGVSAAPISRCVKHRCCMSCNVSAQLGRSRLVLLQWFDG